MRKAWSTLAMKLLRVNSWEAVLQHASHRRTLITSVSCCSRFIFIAEKFVYLFQIISRWCSCPLTYFTRPNMSHHGYQTFIGQQQPIYRGKRKDKIYFEPVPLYICSCVFLFFLLIYSCWVNSVRSRCSSIDWGCRKINYSNSSVYSRLSPFGQLDRYYGHHAIGDKSQSPLRNAQRNNWNKLPSLRSLTMTKMRTLSCSQAQHFTYSFLSP